MTQHSEIVEIVNQRGLHARASAKFVNFVAKLPDGIRVTVAKDGNEADGSSILGLMMLGHAILKFGTEAQKLEHLPNITQGKIGSAPGQAHVASTLLYDTVLKQFVAGSVLRYGLEAYNAKRDGSNMPKLETQAKIFQNNQIVVQGNVNKFDAAPQRTYDEVEFGDAQERA